VSELRSVQAGPAAGTGAVPDGGTAEEVVLETHPRGAATARALVQRLVAPHAPHGTVETAVLLTSELATNAVLHAQGEVVVRVQVGPDLLTVTVTDTSPRTPALRTPRLDATGGRGLVLVEALSSRWGSRLVRGGKAVWFELALPAR
jgi:anti-sigma regulatory factor (Ser/Thr protein kinase)